VPRFVSLTRLVGALAQRLATRRRSLVGLRRNHGRLGGLFLLRRRRLQRMAAAVVAYHGGSVFIGSGGVRCVIVARERRRRGSESQSGKEDGRLHGWPLKMAT